MPLGSPPVGEVVVGARGPRVRTRRRLPGVLFASVAHQAGALAAVDIRSWAVVSTMAGVEVVPEIIKKEKNKG